MCICSSWMHSLCMSATRALAQVGSKGANVGHSHVSLTLLAHICSCKKSEEVSHVSALHASCIPDQCMLRSLR